MATRCPICSAQIGANDDCPRCNAVRAPLGELARRKAELDARWRQRIGDIGLAIPPVKGSFAASPSVEKSPHLRPPAVLGDNYELPQKLVDTDIERVRFSGEHRFAEMLGGLVDVPAMAKLVGKPDPEAIRRQLKVDFLMLTETMAPGLHMTAKSLANYFNIDESIEIYQTAGEENAAMHFVLSPVILEISGQLLPRTDELMLRALIGHELGHYLAHGQQNPLRDSALAVHVVMANRAALPEEVIFAACRLSMAKELTADRFGLLAARNLDGALRLAMTIVSGLSSDAIILDAASYLDQARELMEHALNNDETARGTSHPEHSLRAYAQWLYSESDAFKQLTGTGSGRFSLADVDAKLINLLGMPRLELQMDPDTLVARLMSAESSIAYFRSVSLSGKESFKLFGGATLACRACGEDVSTDADECPKCGEDLRGFKLLGGATIDCRACGAKVSTDADECPECGEDLQGFKLLGGSTIECRACGAKASTVAEECPKCGEDLLSFKLLGGATIECRACGARVSTDANECPKCGEVL